MNKTILTIIPALALLLCAGVMYGQNLDASSFTIQKNEELKSVLTFEDKQDVDDAKRGFIATIDSGVIMNQNGSVSFSMKVWDFLKEDAPNTANPSLWRQSQLNSIHGLFEVVEGKIYQIRGFDVSNMSFVRTDNGWIVIDPLSAEAPVRAGYDLIRQYVEKGVALPVKAIIITHPHADHYGGINAILENAPNDDMTIYAPKDYYLHAVNENIIAGQAMMRRAFYMYGMLLPRYPLGGIGSGLGQISATGQKSLPRQTIEIDEATKPFTVDGLEVRTIFAPETEAPVQIMIYFPEYKAFCVAEEMNRLIHNLLTLRGAKVRNGQLWSKAIDNALIMCGDEVEYSFSTHNWPTFGNNNIVQYWEDQRDLYRFLHDQTLRLANLGFTPIEIAEMISLPESLSNKFYSRGYYGTVSHNVKAQYQLYFGWYDGNPANLHSLPPADAGKKYVEAMGGASAVLQIAQKAYNEGDYRWGAMLLNHLVFADAKNQNARNLLADMYTQLGYQAESGPWRNIYLSGAMELRNKPDTALLTNMLRTTESAFLTDVNNMSGEMLFDFLGVKIDGDKAAGEKISIHIALADTALAANNFDATLLLSNGALTNRIGKSHANPDVAVTAIKNDFGLLLLYPNQLDPMIAAGKISIAGNKNALVKFLSYIHLDPVYFNIIEP